VYIYSILQEKRLVNLPNLNRGDSSQDQPSLSADGRLIAYISSERGKSDVMVYDRSRSRATLLTANLRGSVRNPTISGDGRQIAFETNQDGQMEYCDR
jgi:Tol biopolymer transport system component